MSYEKLLKYAELLSVHVDEKKLSKRNKGLYSDGHVWINSHLSTLEKGCILAEELGHYHTTYGDITDQTKLVNRKQELRARQWAYEKLIPLNRIVDAYHARVKGRHEMAEFLNVTEEFLQATINRYQERYGMFKIVDNKYIIIFNPLGVAELFN